MQMNFNPLTRKFQQGNFGLDDVNKYQDESVKNNSAFPQGILPPTSINNMAMNVVNGVKNGSINPNLNYSINPTELPPITPLPSEPTIDTDSIMKGIDNSLVPKMNADTLADTNGLAADSATMEKANVSGFGTASAITGQGNPLLMSLGAAGGIINGIQANKARTEELRRREIEVEQALAQNQSEREKIDMLNPNANFRAKMGMLQDGRSQAMQQAANVGGASVSSSGLGGDVGSAKIAAMKASAPMAQAGAMFDQQMAGAVDQKTAEENQIIGQLSNNTMQRGQLSQMTDYITKEKNKSPFTGIMSSALAGMTGMSMMSDMVGGKKDVKLTPGK